MARDTTITNDSKVSLGLALTLVAAVASVGLGVGVIRAALADKPGEPQVRVIAREEIKAANVANGTDVAVLTSRLEALDKSMQGLTSEQAETNKLLRSLAARNK